MIKRTVSTFLASLALTVGASAATIVFDNQSAHQGGSFTFGTTAGSTASLTNGIIDQVTNAGDGSFSVTGSCATFGCLNFTTGTFLSSSVTGSTTSYVFAAGGSITVVGTANGVTGTLFSDPTGFAAPITLSVNMS